MATQSRTILVSFIIAYSFYFYIQNVDKKKILFIYSLLFSTFSLLVISLQFKNFFLNNIKGYLELITLFESFIFNLEKPDVNDLDGKLWSMAYRLEHWLIFYKQFLLNPFTIVFGTGSTFIYYESTIFRILFGTGIFGFLFVMYGIRKYHCTF